MSDIAPLWERIKDAPKKNPPPCIVAAPLPRSLRDFTIEHYLENERKGLDSVVAKDVQDALARLENASIGGYHITCASLHTVPATPVLCIHYENAEGRFALAVPGIAYFR